MDWKDALQGLLDEGALGDALNPQHEGGSSSTAKKKPVLKILYEKRRGKPTTIICGFEDTCDESRELASLLKRRLACGGSERGGEILLQGDVRDKVRVLLREMGYLV